MKTKIFLSAFIAIALVFQSNAQIKVLSNGTVAVGTSTVPSGYGLNMYANRLMMTSNPNNYSLIFDFGPSDPRIWTTSSSNSINFLNSDKSNWLTLQWVDIQCRTLYQNSDLNNKANVASIKDGLNTVKQLRGVSFNWKSDIAKKKNKKNYGFIAQEVEPLIKDAVVTDDTTGNKMLSYSSIEPYLVEAIKELSQQVDSLKQLINKNSSGSLKSATTTSEATPIDKSTGISPKGTTINSNRPNPFSEKTNIDYYLENGQGTINIYDMNGAQIKSYPVTSGAGSIIINGAELRPGIYLFNLIYTDIDGQLQATDTKKMILTQ